MIWNLGFAMVYTHFFQKESSNRNPRTITSTNVSQEEPCHPLPPSPFIVVTLKHEFTCFCNHNLSDRSISTSTRHSYIFLSHIGSSFRMILFILEYSNIYYRYILIRHVLDNVCWDEEKTQSMSNNVPFSWISI